MSLDSIFVAGDKHRGYKPPPNRTNVNNNTAKRSAERAFIEIDDRLGTPVNIRKQVRTTVIPPDAITTTTKVPTKGVVVRMAVRSAEQCTEGSRARRYVLCQIHLSVKTEVRLASTSNAN